MSGKAGQQAHRVQEGQRPLCPPVSASQAQGTGSLQTHLNAPQPQALPSWLLGVQPPTSTQAGRALTHTAHPSFCPVGCHA